MTKFEFNPWDVAMEPLHESNSEKNWQESVARIERMKAEHGQAWLGNVNRKSVESSLRVPLVEYTGQKIYNFDYAFVMPAYNQDIEDMVEAYNRQSKAFYDSVGTDKLKGTTKDLVVSIDVIFDKVEELQGKLLYWS